MSILIRKERSGDLPQIHAVTVAAFLQAPHTSHTEQLIVQALRDSGALTVSLVAEDSGQVLGHVALSPVKISDGTEGWYGLGPISVAPSEQGRGIGTQLMHAALDELKGIGANGCVLLGEPAYYQRFGFKPVAGLLLPGVPPEYFQAVKFKGTYPQGAVTYHESFQVMPDSKEE